MQGWFVDVLRCCGAAAGHDHLSSQGAAGLLLDVSPVWGEDWRLFFVNTHFSVLGGVDGRRDNLAELVHFMQGFIAGRGQLLPRN